MEHSSYPFPYLKDKFEQLIQWKKLGFTAKKGILIGSDRAQEQLLPWWWKHYEKENRLPVAVIDFGMSNSMRRWCRNKGVVIDCEVPLYLLKNRMPKFYERVELLTKEKFFKQQMRRMCFFKKPFALLNSPFEQTLWIDHDCRIGGPLEPIFSYSDNPNGISLTLVSPEKHRQHIKWGWIKRGDRSYNSGVIPYKHSATIIQEWAAAVVCKKKYYYGDQNVLTDLINEKQITFPPLPLEYNWIIKERGYNPKATVLHYSGLTFPLGRNGDIVFDWTYLY